MKAINSLLRNIRFYILLFSITFSAAVFFLVTSTTPAGSFATIKITQIYALTAVTFLYFALLAGPFCYTFKSFPLRGQYLKARRAIGVSAFYFGILHAEFAFFGELGGFKGIPLLDGKYFLAISLSYTALLILTLMAVTSFDFMVEKLTFPKWKLLHRFVYLAGILILAHALLIGSHFSNLSSLIPKIFFFAISFLLLLEAPRFDNFLKKFIKIPSGLSIIITAIGLITIFFTFILK